MRFIVRLLLHWLLFVLVGTAMAQADVITNWNEIGIAAGYRAKLTPVPHSRNVAMVQVAMFEAVNAITPRYKAYKLNLHPPSEISAEIAAATAAHDLLTRLYPDQTNDFDARYLVGLWI